LTLPTGETVNFAYDVDGNLTTRTETTGASTDSVDYLYDTHTGLPHAVSASDGTWWLYLDGHPIAQHVNGQTYYLHSDIHDDIRLTTDTTGTVTDTFTWTTDGELVSRTGTTDISVGYRGETYDPTTNLIWLRARWYDPASARFLTADPWMGNPATPTSLNRYLYANADPVNLHDPTGASVDQASMTSQVSAMVVASVLFAIDAYSFIRLLNQIRNDQEDTTDCTDIDLREDHGIDGSPGLDPNSGRGGDDGNRRFGTPSCSFPPPRDEENKLWRGVADTHFWYPEASAGLAVPGDVFGATNVIAHNQGVTQNSALTSWTTDYETAVQFATDNYTTCGVILEIDADDVADRIWQSPDLHSESEVLVEGIVANVKVIVGGA